MDEQEVLKKLVELMYVTRKTGALHPLQMKNIQMWGYLTFSQLKPAKIEPYFHFDKRTVTYVVDDKLEAKTKKAKNKQKEEWTRLAVWIRNLLGDEYAVAIEAKGEVVFRAKRLAPIPKPAEYKYTEPTDE